jgi:hypothetical protein
MIKSPEIVGAFSEVFDASEFTGQFWFSVLKGMVFVGCVCGFVVLGAAAAQSLGLLFTCTASPECAKVVLLSQASS